MNEPTAEELRARELEFADSLPPVTRLLYLDDEDGAVERIESSDDPVERGDDGYSALHMACTRGHASAVEALVRQGAGVNAADDAGFTPLVHAARSGCLPVIDLLLAEGADPRATTHELGYTPLIRAAEHGHVQAVERFLDAGVEPDDSPLGRMTALMVAAEWGHLDVLRLLLARGADPSLECDGQRARDHAAHMGQAAACELLDGASSSSPAAPPAQS